VKGDLWVRRCYHNFATLSLMGFLNVGEYGVD
jgi:hypothetical protein